MSAGKLPVGKLLLLAAGASGSCIVNGLVSAVSSGGSANAGLALGLTSLLGSIFGGYFTNLSQHKLEDGPTPPESLILNRDLRHLTGEAIAAVIELATKPDEYGKHRVPESQHAIVLRMRDGAIEAWMSESTAADTRFEGLSEQQLATEFATAEVEFSHHRALDPATWVVFLETLAQPLDEKPAPETLNALAKLLHERLPQMIRGKVKQDFEGDTETGGRGFASLHLMLMGKLLEGVKTLVDRPDAQKSMETELLEQLKRFNENAGPRIDQHDKRLSPKDRATLSGVIHQLNTLRPHIDKRIDEVLHAITAMRVEMRGQHKETSHRLKWIAASIVVAVLLGGIGWAMVMSSQQETRRVTADLVNRLDESETLIKQFLAERPLDSKGQPIIPQLIGDLKMRAEELIAKGNKRQRLVAAVAMNDFTTADRLQAEIRAQNKAERDAEDFELATLDGDRWYRANEPDKAIEPYELALKLRPSDINTRNSAAIAHTFARRGSIEAHQKRAIEIHQDTLNLVKPRTIDWAITQHLLSIAWSDMPTGDRATNLRNAIAASEAAMTVLTHDAHPVDWAAIQNNLACMWQEMPTGERGMNLRKSIAACEAALTVFTHDAHPVDWAATQNNLGNAWQEMPTRNRAANLQKAIAAYEAALTVRTRDAHPSDWADTQNNLGAAWQDMPTGDHAANLAKAIAAYEATMTVYTKDSHPVDWAATQNNLGNAWQNMPTGNRAANLAKAIAAYEAAITVRTKDADPVGWAATQNNLGSAWQNMPSGDPAANLAKAIAAYEAAITVRTKDADLVGWAVTQNNLGSAWQNMPTGNRAANLAKAIAAYEAAITVLTKDADPVGWAATQNNLGSAWQKMPTGDRAANLAKAIAAHEAALTVYMKDAHPVDWAITQNNLGNALARQAELPKQDGCALLRRAIACGKGALLVRTEEAFPGEHEQTKKNLAIIRRAYESAGCDKAVPFDAIAPVE